MMVFHSICFFCVLLLVVVAGIVVCVVRVYKVTLEILDTKVLQEI